MPKTIVSLACSVLLLIACNNKQQNCEPGKRNKNLDSIDSLAASLNWPAELTITGFTGPDITPSPACLAVAATGEVYVGVDMIGSLGKEPGKGMIIKLIDCNNDGIPDSHTEYAAVDNPRGIISLGDKLYVLHTMFSKDSLATGMDLVVFEDKNNDGVADGPSKPLIEHISNLICLNRSNEPYETGF